MNHHTHTFAATTKLLPWIVNAPKLTTNATSMESCNIRMSFIEMRQVEVVDFPFFIEREIAIIILCQLAHSTCSWKRAMLQKGQKGEKCMI